MPKPLWRSRLAATAAVPGSVVSGLLLIVGLPPDLPCLLYGFVPAAALQVPVEVQPDLLQELLQMGFSEARASRGLHFSGNSSIEGAINWLAEHEADEDLDTPLLVPKVWARVGRVWGAGTGEAGCWAAVAAACEVG